MHFQEQTRLREQQLCEWRIGKKKHGESRRGCKGLTRLVSHSGNGTKKRYSSCLLKALLLWVHQLVSCEHGLFPETSNGPWGLASCLHLERMPPAKRVFLSCLLPVLCKMDHAPFTTKHLLGLICKMLKWLFSSASVLSFLTLYRGWFFGFLFFGQGWIFAWCDEKNEKFFLTLFFSLFLPHTHTHTSTFKNAGHSFFAHFFWCGPRLGWTPFFLSENCRKITHRCAHVCVYVHKATWMHFLYVLELEFLMFFFSVLMFFLLLLL